jgi:hypothetical protein
MAIIRIDNTIKDPDPQSPVLNMANTQEVPDPISPLNLTLVLIKMASTLEDPDLILIRREIIREDQDLNTKNITEIMKTEDKINNQAKRELRAIKEKWKYNINNNKAMLKNRKDNASGKNSILREKF